MKTLPWKSLLLGAALLLPLGCQINEVECDEDCESSWMDGSRVNDSSADSLDKYHYYLVSKRKDSLPKAVRDTFPVIIAAHGFSASTFEWLELRQYARDIIPWPDSLANTPKPKALISLVLLGGHGRDVSIFKGSTWQQWAAPILEEYDSLVAQGYKNISLAGSSTGCPLILQLMHGGHFNKQPPNQILFIDPIVSPSAKILSLIRIFGPILGNNPSNQEGNEKKHWYTNRPAETLDELYTVINRAKNQLEDGMTLPRGTKAKVWKATDDGQADPVSALMLYKGLRTASGGRIEVKMVPSSKHVFTRLSLRGGTHEDTTRRDEAFKEMIDRATAWPGKR
ncbi:MAG TPA: esterase [Fibrobacteria bacterium]|nr:esterase [Fibrobacteria bacterium]